MTTEGTPATGPGSNRYQRYANAGLDIEGKERKQKVGVNEGRRGYSDSDGPAEKAERAETARQAITKGMHGSDRTDEEIADEERRRQLEGDSHGTPIDHTGFSEADQQRLKDAAQFDADAFNDEQGE